MFYFPVDFMGGMGYHMFKGFERVFYYQGGAKLEYKEKIIEMIENIEDIRFLRQIYTIIIKYIKKKAGS